MMTNMLHSLLCAGNRCVVVVVCVALGNVVFVFFSPSAHRLNSWFLNFSNQLNAPQSPKMIKELSSAARFFPQQFDDFQKRDTNTVSKSQNTTIDLKQKKKKSINMDLKTGVFSNCPLKRPLLFFNEIVLLFYRGLTSKYSRGWNPPLKKQTDDAYLKTFKTIIGLIILVETHFHIFAYSRVIFGAVLFQLCLHSTYPQRVWVLEGVLRVLRRGLRLRRRRQLTRLD